MAIDFNMIEYAQRLNHFLPQLQAKGVGRVICIVNGSPKSCQKLSEMLDLSPEIELLSDEAGDAGREFGVGRGFMPDDDKVTVPLSKLLESLDDIDVPISPYAKLFAMLLGAGARDTLPSVITGYLGNPSGKHEWIEASLAQGQRQGRWPANVLELDAASGTVARNPFDELPVVGGWGRRPFELATLRLQTMVGVSLKEWGALQPTDERTLTQLGGLVVVNGEGNVVYEYRDNGICNVADFDKLLEDL